LFIPLSSQFYPAIHTLFTLYNDVVVKRSKILLQASLHQLSDLLPLVSSYNKIIIGKFLLIVQFSFIKKTENPAKDSRFLMLYD